MNLSEEFFVDGQPPCKKKKIASSGKDFVVLMASSTALKTAVEIMSHTLIDATFAIKQIGEKSEGNVDLRVDAMDNSLVCACKLKIECSGEVNMTDDDCEFCIKLKPFLEILRALPGNEGIRICRKETSSQIEIKTLGAECHYYKIQTLEDTCNSNPLDICESTYSVDFDLTKLKAHLRVVTNLKSDALKFEIFKVEDHGEYSGQLVFKLSCKGQDASAEWHFFSPTSESQVSFLPRELKRAPLKTLYSEEYSTEYLKNFTKSMERSNVILSFNDNEPKVIVLEYSLGQENSSINFLLAPKISES